MCRRKLKDNGENKIMRCTREASGRMNDEVEEGRRQFQIMSWILDGKIETEITARMKKAGKVFGGMNRLSEIRALGCK